MNKISIISLGVVAASLFSCSSEDDCAALEGNGSMLQISAEMESSRAIKDGTAFAEGDTIGIILGYDSNIIADDLYAVYNGKDWEMSEQIDLSKYEGSLPVRAYYPYNAQISQNRMVMHPGITDYMSDSTAVGKAAPVAKLTFRHNMAKVTFHIAKGENLDGFNVESIVLSKFASSGLVFIASNVVRAEGEADITIAVNREADESVDVQYLVIPSEQAATTATVTVSGKAYDFALPATTYEQGKAYSYNITINGDKKQEEPVADEIEIDGRMAVYLGIDAANGKRLYWATCNVGATKPEGYGDYFTWGLTEPFMAEGSEFGGEGSGIGGEIPDVLDLPANSRSGSLSYGKTLDKLKTEDIIGEDGNLTAKYDAATANWGKEWRMPSKAEFSELVTKCTTEWISLNGVNGRKVTGSNGKSIFMPAAGGYGEWSSLLALGKYGYYWSSTPSDGIYIDYFLFFDSSNFSIGDGIDSYQKSVRAVTER